MWGSPEPRMDVSNMEGDVMGSRFGGVGADEDGECRMRN